ncbi:MAG: hypothetical protein ACLPKE_13980 [Streptosporangiaceae bacterium]
MDEILNVHSGITTVPGTGSGSLDSLIQLHLGWGKSFLILLDGDSEGIKQRRRYEQVFGPLLKDRCILLPDICGDSQVKEAEDLFSARDKERITSVIYPTGVERPNAKKAFMQAVIELYARKQAVQVGPSTVRRFTSAFQELSKRLT